MDRSAQGMTTELRARNLGRANVGPFTFSVTAGHCLAVTGPSGSGKTLLLRMLADLDPADGEVTLDRRARESWSGPEWRRQVGYMPAEPGWWADDPLQHFTDEGQARALCGRLLVRSDVLDLPVAQASTGERQRLALARALLAEPRVLLLDEPTAALDAAATEAAETLLRERMREGLALVMVTHDEALAGRLGTSRLRIRDGRVE